MGKHEVGRFGEYSLPVPEARDVAERLDEFELGWWECCDRIVCPCEGWDQRYPCACDECGPVPGPVGDYWRPQVWAVWPGAPVRGALRLVRCA